MDPENEKVALPTNSSRGNESKTDETRECLSVVATKALTSRHNSQQGDELPSTVEESSDHREDRSQNSSRN